MAEVSDIQMLKEQARAELNKLEAQSPAKDVAGRAVGKHGLMYITTIVVVGVGASIVLDESKIAAVIGLVSAALTALISMLNGVAGANAKQERPEFEVMKQLIDKLVRLDREEQPMRVDVVGDKVTVTKGADKVSAARE
jgi:hypothetical protein